MGSAGLPGISTALVTTPVTLPVHVTCAVRVPAQLACGSPSETVTVMDAVPGVAHVNDGFCAVGLLIVPPVACHWYVSALGALSASWAEPASAMLPPTSTSAGLALMPSTTGQTFVTPLTLTEPVLRRLVAVEGDHDQRRLSRRDVEGRPSRGTSVAPSVAVEVRVM